MIEPNYFFIISGNKTSCLRFWKISLDVLSFNNIENFISVNLYNILELMADFCVKVTDWKIQLSAKSILP